jgi:hypothetical protein
VHIKLATADGAPIAQFEQRVAEIARARLARTSEFVDQFVAGTIDIF